MNEQEVTKYWEEHGVPKKALKRNAGKKKWYFLDGPPYATGAIHMGTAFNKILKDYYIRYHRMLGEDAWAQPGYDTHGVPIEHKVEQQLGIKDKKEIEELGVARFVAECRAFAEKHIKIMNDQFSDLGVWMDWDNPYITYKNSYIEGAWHTFKVGYEKGLLYKGKYAVHSCPHCETVVAYNEIVYQELEDTSVYVKFPLKGRENEYLFIWTTTPWTLPSNTGVMAHPDFTYARVRTGAGDLWMAKELVQSVMGKMEAGYTIIEERAGRGLEGWEYENPLGALPLQKGVQGRVVLTDKHVHLEGGTGLVHCAPGHGEEDFEVGKANGLPALSPVLLNGTYDESAGKYAGLFVKDADSVIISDLKASGHLLYSEPVRHDYPLCWRCRSPLLFISVPQWFFKITDMKDELIKQNSKITWVPDWAGKRLENWFQSLGDWPISRQRYWGIPLPIWVCEECGNTRVIGSVAELGQEVSDLHKPFIDDVVLECDCGGKMKRVPDVLDVWFDSGVAPWASLDYVKDPSLFERLWPVDFVLEGPDQTRGWWNSLSICGLITFGRIPFSSILQHGLVLAEGGVKMSKSRGNVIAPEQIVEKYSRDLLRYYLLRWDSSSDFDFSWEKAEELKRFFNTLENTFRFFELYCERSDDLSLLLPEDEWVLSRMNSLIAEVKKCNDAFVGYKSVQAVEDFVVNDLSRWYVKLIRERTWPTYDGEDKQAAFATLYYVLKRVNALLAPVLPYKAEDFNRRLFDEESVHLTDFPEADESRMDAGLEVEMALARAMVEAAANARSSAKVKLRWPLRAMDVRTDDDVVKAAVRRFSDVLKSQCNVKDVTVNAGIRGEEAGFAKGSVVLDVSMDEGLRAEALAKDVIRTVQSMRKKHGFEVGDAITLNVSGDGEVNALLGRAQPIIVSKVNATSFGIGGEGEFKETIKFDEKQIIVAFSKA
ncbi:MAG: isoleucine--tRNA ligase [Candidatus Diapherotrites archaeon]|nr:isoleucine--tRNA ligase [Candidatus Diapherotrites archaeon]